ncbi:MAG TPA: hypothetical protein VML19_12890 [Verrucomicrobiae bacterium]|nr:hypothetical protein [Verrucomicrobiae bacterium]
MPDLFDTEFSGLRVAIVAGQMRVGRRMQDVDLRNAMLSCLGFHRRRELPIGDPRRSPPLAARSSQAQRGVRAGTAGDAFWPELDAGERDDPVRDDRTARRLTVAGRHGAKHRSAWLFLAGQDNVSQPLDMFLTQQAVLAEASIGPVDVHAIEKRHEAHHEDNRKQRAVLGHWFAPIF